MKVSIGIPSYNGMNRIYWLLKSIRENSNIPENEYEVTVIDDCSTFNRGDEVKKICEEFKVNFIQNEKNLGIVKNWNRLCKDAKSENIVLLNDDIIVTEHWLESILYFLDNNENVGAVGFPTFFMLEKDMPKYFTNKYLPPRDPGTKLLVPFEKVKEQTDSQNNPPGACAIVVGCAFGFKKSAWEKVGGFDENIHSLFEDYSYGSDLLLNKFQNYTLRYPIIYHVLSATFSGNPELKAYQLMRESGAYYEKKYGGKVTDVADRLFEAQKELKKVKFLDRELNSREDYCSL
jgi:GT2 family glycosyltransferase